MVPLHAARLKASRQGAKRKAEPAAVGAIRLWQVAA
jgi:hypothetical protein